MTTHEATDRDDLAEALVQIGRDEMARALADWLDELKAEAAEGGELEQHYVDGIGDAILTLGDAGAADPRAETTEPDPLSVHTVRHAEAVPDRLRAARRGQAPDADELAWARRAARQPRPAA